MSDAVIRPRTEADLAGAVALLAETQRADGYPRFVLHANAEFLAPVVETDAWVAEMDGRVVGHVALHAAAGDPVLPYVQAASGLPPERLAVLARLLVSPQARGLRIGGRLLQAATERAAERGQRVGLDVVRDAAGPIAVYERAGWVRVGEFDLDVGEGHLPMYAYLGPDPCASGERGPGSRRTLAHPTGAESPRSGARSMSQRAGGDEMGGPWSPARGFR